MPIYEDLKKRMIKEDMKYITTIFIFASFIISSACSPIAIIGMVGSTVSRTVENTFAHSTIDGGINTVRNPDRIAIANVNLGVEYMRQGNYERALERLNYTKQVKPEYAPTYNVLGLLHQRLDDVIQAEINFRKSIQLDNGNPDFLNNYGQFLCKQDRDIEAIEYFLEAARDPFYEAPEIPFSNAGTCAYKHSHIDKAVGYFEKALSLNPNIPTTLIQMSEICYDKGDHLAAHEYLDRYVDLSRHTAKSLWLGIRIERQLGNKDAVSSYALLLRNNFSEEKEAELLKESGAR